jgi:hypothetical protein
MCRGNRLATVVPASTVIATAVATWASDYMQERNHQVGKSVCGHFTCCSISSFFLSPKAYLKSNAW